MQSRRLRTCPGCGKPKLTRTQIVWYQSFAYLAGFRAYVCLDCERRFLKRPTSRNRQGTDHSEVEWSPLHWKQVALLSGTVVGVVAIALTLALKPWADSADRVADGTITPPANPSQPVGDSDQSSDDLAMFAGDQREIDQPVRSAASGLEVVALKPVIEGDAPPVGPGLDDVLQEELVPFHLGDSLSVKSRNSTRLPGPYRRHPSAEGLDNPDRETRLAKYDLTVGIAMVAEPTPKPIPQLEQIQIAASLGAIDPVPLQSGDDNARDTTAGDSNAEESVTLSDGNPSSPDFDVILSRARELAAMRDYQAAIELYTQAIKLRPEEPLPFNLRGIAHVYLKHYEAAINDYDRAILLAPDVAATFNNRGNVFLRMKKFELARSDYTRCLELEPGNSVAYDNRGIVHSHLGDYQAAITDHTESLRLNNKNATAYHNRGVAYYRAGNKSLAEADFAKARELLQRSR